MVTPQLECHTPVQWVPSHVMGKLTSSQPVSTTVRLKGTSSKGQQHCLINELLEESLDNEDDEPELDDGDDEEELLELLLELLDDSLEDDELLDSLELLEDSLLDDELLDSLLDDEPLELLLDDELPGLQHVTE